VAVAIIASLAAWVAVSSGTALGEGAPVSGSGLFLACELVAFSRQLRRCGLDASVKLTERIMGIVAFALAGSAVGSLVLAAAKLPVPRSVLATAAGGAAAAGAIWLVARFAAEPPGPRERDG
jgi:hypothetical protein